MIETLVTAPTVEPVSAAQAMAHCRVDSVAESEQFERWITAAREYAETYTHRQLLQATWKLWMDSWWCDDVLELPHAPLMAVSSIAYYDGDNASQTWASSNYVTLASAGPKSRPGRVQVAYGVTFPTLYPRPDAVTVTWTAGYGTSAGDVPAAIRQAILLLVGEMNERRELVVVGTIQSPNVLAADRLLDPFVSHGRRW